MRIHRLLSVALCSAFLPLAAHAQNLIANPNFDHDLSGWTVEHSSAVWSNQDAGASAFSGSLAALPVAIGQGAIIRSNCFAALPGNYQLEYKHREPGSDQFGVTAFLRWYSDANCNAWFDSSTSFGGSHHYPTWQTIRSAGTGFDLIAPAGTRSAALAIYTDTPAYFDDVIVTPFPPCTSSACLGHGRFAISVHWFTATASGQGTPIDVTGESATYWFFGEGNIELVVKVLRGCPLNGHYWVFIAGLTDVRVEVTITDLVTGVPWTYVNPLGEPFPPIQDTSAFATCP